MNKYLIAYGYNKGLNNPTFLIGAKNENEAISIFRMNKGLNHKIQLIKKVNY